MRASKIISITILCSILLLIDWYVFQAVDVTFQGASAQIQGIVKWAYWGFTALTIAALWAYNFANPDLLGPRLRKIILSSLLIIYLSKLVPVVFVLIDDIIRFFKWIKQSIFPDAEVAGTIERSYLLMKTAVVAATLPATAFTWGIISGAHDYRIRNIRLAIKDLPKQFEGMTIAQVSDIHSGSFFNKTAVKGGVEMLMQKKPDMVFFTGDLVNNEAREVKDYINIFDKIKAPLGVYSTLGNHDYGDYTTWPSLHAKQHNLQQLMQAHKIMGYDLLMDENRKIKLGDEELAIVGVQNISGHEHRFHSYGNLPKAMQGTDEAAVKLLLSHDPTHWDKEVNTKFPDVDVMFSGHTHGAQFGINVFGKTYSPAQWAYKQWAGLYQEGDQQLYVNRGYGYLGYPGRVGMPPEITIFELARV
ncbi:MAG: metallophosphoesterase [Bacteroidetes bacterium]|nr:metallophosphoesterase [Bacteroidota bacterium]